MIIFRIALSYLSRLLILFIVIIPSDLYMLIYPSNLLNFVLIFPLKILIQKVAHFSMHFNFRTVFPINLIPQIFLSLFPLFDFISYLYS